MSSPKSWPGLLASLWHGEAAATEHMRSDTHGGRGGHSGALNDHPIDALRSRHGIHGGFGHGIRFVLIIGAGRLIMLAQQGPSTQKLVGISVTLTMLAVMLATRWLLEKGIFASARVKDMLLFLFSCLMLPMMLWDLDDSVFRHRAFAMFSVQWRSVLLKFCSVIWGHRESHCFVAAMVLSASELYWTMCAFHKDNVPMPYRVIFVLVVLNVLYIQEALLQRAHRQRIEDLQTELADEKNAQESLISMLCDSYVHIAPDGDTVLRSTPHFDSLMEMAANGASLKGYLPRREGEQARLADAFTRARRKPVALPVTLLSKKMVPLKMDLFIVRRREMSSEMSTDAENKTVGFLVGVRVDPDSCNASSSLALPTAEMEESAVYQETRQESAMHQEQGAKNLQHDNGPPAQCPEEAAASVKAPSDAPSLLAPSEAALRLAPSVPGTPVHTRQRAPSHASQHSKDDQASLLEGSLLSSACGVIFQADPLVRNTFLHFPLGSGGVRRRCNSAPPDLSRTAGRSHAEDHVSVVSAGLQTNSSFNWSGLENEWNVIHGQSRSLDQLPSVLTSFSQHPPDGPTHVSPTGAESQSPPFPPSHQDFASMDEQSCKSSEMSAFGGVVVKVGPCIIGKQVSSSLSLTELLRMKSGGRTSIGSQHSSNAKCIPCSFHFSHVHMPGKKLPCKASYMCEYCHDVSHQPKYRSKFRKLRPPPPQSETLEPGNARPVRPIQATTRLTRPFQAAGQAGFPEVCYQ